MAGEDAILILTHRQTRRCSAGLTIGAFYHLTWKSPASDSRMEVRFSQLVKTSGKPGTITLWTKPQDRPELMKAMSENRVLTVIRKGAKTRKDFGQIGFHQRPSALYLLFPKPLPKEADLRVVGIKYELIEEPPVAKPISRPSLKNRSKSTPRSVDKQFQVLLERTAKTEGVRTVRAKNRRDAGTQAVQEVSEKPFDSAKAAIRTGVKFIKQT